MDQSYLPIDVSQVVTQFSNEPLNKSLTRLAVPLTTWRQQGESVTSVALKYDQSPFLLQLRVHRSHSVWAVAGRRRVVLCLRFECDFHVTFNLPVVSWCRRASHRTSQLVVRRRPVPPARARRVC